MINKKYILLGLFISIVLGCATVPVGPKPDPRKDIDNATKNNASVKSSVEDLKGNIAKRSLSIKDSSGKIIGFSTNIEGFSVALEDAYVSDKLDQKTFSLNIQGIKDNNNFTLVEAKKLRAIGEELDQYKSKFDNALKSINDLSLRLKGAGDSVGQLTAQNQKLEQEAVAKDKKIATLESENNKLLNYVLTGLIIIGVLAIVGAGMVFFFSQGTKSSLALSLGAAGLLLMIVSSATMMYLKNNDLAGLIAGGVGVVAILWAVIHQVWVNKKATDAVKAEVNNAKAEVDTANTALKETVATVEAVKTLLPEPVKKDFFGDGPVPGKVTNIQSDSTADKVLSIREGMKRRWEPTIKLK